MKLLRLDARRARIGGENLKRSQTEKKSHARRIGILAIVMAAVFATSAAGRSVPPGGDTQNDVVCFDAPQWVDECMDTMTGDLTFASGTGVRFADRLTGPTATDLVYGSNRVCLANVPVAGCTGSGTVLRVDSGVGLSGGPITSTGTLSLNINGGASQTCSGNQKAQGLSPTGILSCAVDQDTLYSAGTGLTLAGTQFQVNPSVVQSRVANGCPSTATIQAIAQDGSVTCHTDANSGGTVTTVATGAGLQGGPFSTSGTIDLRLASSGGLSKTINGNELGIASGGVTNGMLQNSHVGVNAGSGLTGGGNAFLGNAVALALNVAGITSCTGATQKVLWDSGNDRLTCGTDAGITSLSTGTGLSGGPITSTGTISLNLNGGSSQSCPGTQKVTSLSATGFISCANDDSASYTAGNGLSLSGNQFSLASPVSVANGGTGASSASSARSNLGAAASGANSDITSLSALSSLSVSGGSNLATSSGNVGIGTASPNRKLQVAGDVQVGDTGTSAISRRTLFGDSDYVYVGENSRDDWLEARGRLGIYLNTAGSVGVGTSNPSSAYKLDVAGGIRAQNFQAMIVQKSGCNSSVCTWYIPWTNAFPGVNAPAVICSAGPDANTGWNPLMCMVKNPSTLGADIVLHSGNTGQNISGTKNIYLFAMLPT